MAKTPKGDSAKAELKHKKSADKMPLPGKKPAKGKNYLNQKKG